MHPPYHMEAAKQRPHERYKPAGDWLSEMPTSSKLLARELLRFDPRERAPESDDRSDRRFIQQRWRRRELARELIEGLRLWPRGPLSVWKTLAELQHYHCGKAAPAWLKRRSLVDLVGREHAMRLDRARRQSDLWSCDGSMPALIDNHTARGSA